MPCRQVRPWGQFLQNSFIGLTHRPVIIQYKCVDWMLNSIYPVNALVHSLLQPPSPQKKPLGKLRSFINPVQGIRWRSCQGWLNETLTRGVGGQGSGVGGQGSAHLRRHSALWICFRFMKDWRNEQTLFSRVTHWTRSPVLHSTLLMRYISFSNNT